MNLKIYPCINIEGRMVEAVQFYKSIFKDFKVINENQYSIEAEIYGDTILFLNGGPSKELNPAISIFILSNSLEEVKYLWNELENGSQILMELNEYPWSKAYGWLNDKFGLSWQIFHINTQKIDQKFHPHFMFLGENNNKAKNAIDFYTSIFPNSKIKTISKYAEGEGDIKDNIKHAEFYINDYLVMLNSSSYPHQFKLNDSISLVVECETQEEIDKYWDALINDGGTEVMCGWLVDKYGISWQIVPKMLIKLMNDPNKIAKATKAFANMKKLIISDIENAIK